MSGAIFYLHCAIMPVGWADKIMPPIRTPFFLRTAVGPHTLAEDKRRQTKKAVLIKQKIFFKIDTIPKIEEMIE